MRFPALIFLASIALASTGPLPNHNVTSSLEELFSRLAFESNDKPKTTLGLRQEHLAQLLNKTKDSIDHGKAVHENTLQKLKGIQEKLKDLIIKLNQEKEKVKNNWQKILDRLNHQKFTLPAEKDGNKTEIGKKFKGRFDEILQKVKDAIGNGKVVQDDTPIKLKEILEKFHNLNVGLKAQAVTAQLKEKARYLWQMILRRLRGKDERKVPQTELGNRLRKEFDDPLEKQKNTLDKGQSVKEENSKKFATQLISMNKEKGEKGKNKILYGIDQVLPKKEKRSIKEIYEKIKEYFKNLHIELKEKFTRFGEWAKEKFEKGLIPGKTRAENIRKIADEFIKDSKFVSKEVAAEALEFFRDYKEDLGSKYDDIKEKVRERVKRNN